MQVRTVLLIDDEDDIRTIGRLALESVGGYRTLEAASGAEGLEMARRESPDVVLLDVMMPGLDGPATLARLRDDPATRDLPVIFMTAKTQKHEVARFLDCGAIGVITKPFDPMGLSERVAQLVSAAHG